MLQFPGFRGVRLGTVIVLFWRNVTHPSFTLRGSAMAFSFFFALFPGLLFALSWLSYLPFERFDALLQYRLGEVLPPPVYQLVHDIVFQELYGRKNWTLLSTSLFLAMYSLWQGMLTMLRAFLHDDMPKPPFWVLWIRALWLVGFLLLLVIANLTFSFLQDRHLSAMLSAILHSPVGPGVEVLLGILKFITLFLIVSGVVEVMYRAGMPRRSLPYIISPGAFIATFLLGAAMKLLSWYFLAVANFSRFYGSIAAVIALMVWFYWLSIVLLVGFEINYSLYRSILRTRDTF
ncbi:MAG: YihY/virulence factor BrkB family protein [Bacteroidia bacterium]|nr:YihY/virulence factor BrkB family protein [Bacteroidia bacterium]MCX7651448.1 YihY/virulence factor BrkB family protein [Bacteroidia bacterium]MDW8416797.1 YihY/virulence factor BrkB family protein [Bacteroidia bacterium]